VNACFGQRRCGAERSNLYSSGTQYRSLLDDADTVCPDCTFEISRTGIIRIAQNACGNRQNFDHLLVHREGECDPATQDIALDSGGFFWLRHGC